VTATTKINSNSSGSGNSTVRDSNGTVEKIKHSNQASTSSGGVGGTIYNCSTASGDNNPFFDSGSTISNSAAQQVVTIDCNKLKQQSTSISILVHQINLQLNCVALFT